MKIGVLLGLAFVSVSCSSPSQPAPLTPTATVESALPTLVPTDIPPTLTPEILPTACPIERHFEVIDQENPYTAIPVWFADLRPEIELTCTTLEDCVLAYQAITITSHEGEIVARLAADYEPVDLINLAQEEIVTTLAFNQMIRAEAVPRLRAFVQALSLQGYLVMTRSAYRSYDFQAGLYIKEPTAAAPAGFSQHQGGLTVDIWAGDASYNLSHPLYSAEIERLAERHGIVHPYAWDQPHYFILDAIYPGATALIRGQGLDPHHIDTVNGFLLGLAEMAEQRILALGGMCGQE